MAATQKQEVVVGTYAYERDTKNFAVYSREVEGGRKLTEYVSFADQETLARMNDGKPEALQVVLRLPA